MRISDWSSDVCSSDLARAFAAEGLTACVNRRERHADALEALAQSIRDAGDAARAFPADARNEEAMIALFDAVEAEVGPTEVAVFNRSEERRVGKECVSTCRYRGAPYP